MENLLKNAILKQLASRHPQAAQPNGNVNLISEIIADKAFDIIDGKVAGLSVKRNVGQGNATYHNLPKYALKFVRHEDFLDQLGDLSKGVGRCDFLVYDAEGSKSYFILHELSFGSINNKRSKGRTQLFQTLNILSKSDCWNLINEFSHKQCFLSCRDSAVSTPFQMADGFMRIYEELPDPIPMRAKQIERLGFEAWETCDIRLV